ncbi:MAG: hypothetical protein KVP17_003380 [Porospora cf. gigantea B]|uniref:uncharacterized protein n=1 Tax=Porospora cf. gigantea B TaxID=2853592 RepID=UPI003571F83E|nr:MAG: hypothetical protein KVP17_003380 [Porospora cf. gigantea B]
MLTFGCSCVIGCPAVVRVRLLMRVAAPAVVEAGLPCLSGFTVVVQSFPFPAILRACVLSIVLSAEYGSVVQGSVVGVVVRVSVAIVLGAPVSLRKLVVVLSFVQSCLVSVIAAGPATIGAGPRPSVAVPITAWASVLLPWVSEVLAVVLSWRVGELSKCPALVRAEVLLP